MKLTEEQKERLSEGIQGNDSMNDFTLWEIINDEMDSDACRWTNKSDALIKLHERYPSGLDEFLIAICGWSFEKLVNIAFEQQQEHLDQIDFESKLEKKKHEN